MVEAVIEKAKRLVDEGWKIRVRRIKGNLYLTARKTEAGRRTERCLGRVSPEEIKEIKRLIPTVSITTTHSSRKKRKTKKGEGFGKGGRGSDVFKGFGFLEKFTVHKLELHYDVFGKPVSIPALHDLSKEISFDYQSGQCIGKLDIGVSRAVTIRVSLDGSAQVCLECSNNPMDFFEFMGFCKFWLLEIFSKLTGTIVELKDFQVKIAPWFNDDTPRTVIAEGTKNICLKDYLDELIARIYGVKREEKRLKLKNESKAKPMNKVSREDGLKRAIENPTLAVLPARVLKNVRDDSEHTEENQRSIQVLNQSVKICRNESQNSKNSIKINNQDFESLLYDIFNSLEEFKETLANKVEKAVEEAIKKNIQNLLEIYFTRRMIFEESA